MSEITRRKPLSTEESNAVRIGKLIRRHRRGQGLTQQDLSDQARRKPGGEGIYRQLISCFETGRRIPTIYELDSICLVLGVRSRDWI